MTLTADQTSLEHGRRAFRQLFPVVSLAMFVSFGDNTLVATALPAIAAEFGQPSRAGLAISAYLVAMMVAAPVFGRLGDAFGYKTMVAPAVALFVLASTLCALSWNLPALVAFRALQGLGGGGLVALSSAMMAERIPVRQRAAYQGYIATVVVCSYAIGPILSGLLTEFFDWRAVFLLNLPFGMAILWFTRNLPATDAGRRPFRMDLPGVAFLALFVSSLVGTFEAIPAGRVLPVAALVATAAAALVLLIRRERRAFRPLLPAAVLTDPAIRLANLLVLLYGICSVPLLVMLPIYYRTIHGLPPSQIGIAVLPVSAGLVASSLMTGRLVARTGRVLVWGVGGMAMMAAVLCAFALLPGLSLPVILVGLAVVGIGMGTVLGPVQIVVQLAARREDLGSAASTIHVSRLMGAACGTALASSILYLVLARDPTAQALFEGLLAHPAARDATHPPIFDAAFGAVFAVIAAISLAAAGVARAVPLQRL